MFSAQCAAGHLPLSVLCHFVVNCGIPKNSMKKIKYWKQMLPGPFWFAIIQSFSLILNMRSSSSKMFKIPLLQCCRAGANIAAQLCEATLLRPTLWKEFQTVLDHMDHLVWLTKFELPDLICYVLHACNIFRLKQGLFLCTGCIRYLTRLFASAWQSSSVDITRFVIIIAWNGFATLRTWVGNRIESKWLVETSCPQIHSQRQD